MMSIAINPVYTMNIIKAIGKPIHQYSNIVTDTFPLIKKLSIFIPDLIGKMVEMIRKGGILIMMIYTPIYPIHPMVNLIH
jgi:hypothetical protein